MAKLLLVSILLASIAIPAWAARSPDAREGHRRLVFASLLFISGYGLMLRFIYTRLL